MNEDQALGKALRFQIITTFPEMVEALFQQGVVGQAVKAGLIQLQIVNPREYTADLHRSVDDRPYGGGDGMVMMNDPLEKALLSFPSRGHVVYLSPQGRVWTDGLARRFARGEVLPCLRPQLSPARGSSAPIVFTFVCGRYSGVDERFLQAYVADEISVGDFILSGGELAAAILIDSIGRQVPGVLGNHESLEAESFARGLLEGPSYTRPTQVNGALIPEILTGGNHLKIAQWRAIVSLLRTHTRRPDLLLARRWEKSELKSLRKGLALLTDDDLAHLDLGRREESEELLSSFESGESPGARPRKPALAVGLVHWPVVDKAGQQVCTNVTNLDIHDIARTACVYGVDRYYIINRQVGQLAFVQRILDHWRVGEGAHYNEMRQTALGPVETAATIAAAVDAFQERSMRGIADARKGPDRILRIGTSARVQRAEKTITFADLRTYLRRGEGPLTSRGFGSAPVLLLFGTGFGLSPEVEPEIDLWLEPIRGEDDHDYRHLSVRSAVSICLDRLLGTW